MDLKSLDEYVAYDQTQQPQSDVDADIVYVGYGIEAPEYNWDDYKGVDVQRQSLADAGERTALGRSEIFQRQSSHLLRALDLQIRRSRAQRRGGRDSHSSWTEMASYPWEVVRNSNSGEKSYLKLDGPALKVASWVQSRRGEEDGVGVRHEHRQDDAGRAVAGFSSGESAARNSRRTWSARCAPSNRTTWSRCCRASDRKLQERSRDLHRALRSPRHSSGDAGRQHLQRRQR